MHYAVKAVGNNPNPNAGMGVGGGQYNPNPTCQHPNPTILTQECFTKRKSNKQAQAEWKRRNKCVN